MSILIHACCADCLLKLLDALKAESDFDCKQALIVFYNPNIYPREEYQSRLKAVKKVAEDFNIKLSVPNYKPQEYFEVVGGLGLDNVDGETSRVNIPSKKTRCVKCWNLRLNFVFEMAKTEGFDVVTSTLLSSSYQDQDKIRKIAVSLAKKYGVKFKEVENIDHCLKTCGFYKQNFCGCLYSLIEKSREKYGIASSNANPKYSNN